MYSTPMIIDIIGYGLTIVIIIIFLLFAGYALQILIRGIFLLIRRVVFPSERHPTPHQDIEMVHYVMEIPNQERTNSRVDINSQQMNILE